MPLTESAAPARNAVQTLGNLILQKISVSMPDDELKIELGDLTLMPINGAPAKTIRARRSRVDRIKTFFMIFSHPGR